MAAYQNLRIHFQLTSNDPVVDNPSWHHDYLTTFTTQDITDVSSLVTQVVAAFNATPAGGVQAIAKYISPVISRTANKIVINVYDVTGKLAHGQPMGAPVLMTSGTLATTTDVNALPQGVAAAVTLQAPYGTDVEFGPGTRPRARDRGRVFIGPVGTSGFDMDGTTNRCKVNASFRGDLTKWIKSINVITTSPHTVIYDLAVWSRSNAAMKSLQECWVDDRWDYVRLREDQATTRTVLALP